MGEDRRGLGLKPSKGGPLCLIANGGFICHTRLHVKGYHSDTGVAARLLVPSLIGD